VRQLIKLELIFIDNDNSIFWYLPFSLLARSFEAESVLKLYFTEGEFKRNVKTFVVTNNVIDLIAEQVM